MWVCVAPRGLGIFGGLLWFGLRVSASSTRYLMQVLEMFTLLYCVHLHVELTTKGMSASRAVIPARTHNNTHVHTQGKVARSGTYVQSYAHISIMSV